jgi:hypothetical protein
MMQLKKECLGGKKLNVYLEDDGTLDTVVSVNGQTFRFDTEYATQFRNKKGEITKSGWKNLKKEAIDTYEMERDYPSNGGKLPFSKDGIGHADLPVTKSPRISFPPFTYSVFHLSKPSWIVFVGIYPFFSRLYLIASDFFMLFAEEKST